MKAPLVVLYPPLVTSPSLLCTMISILLLRSQGILICALQAPISNPIDAMTTGRLSRHLLGSITIEALTLLTNPSAHLQLQLKDLRRKEEGNIQRPAFSRSEYGRQLQGLWLQ